MCPFNRYAEITQEPDFHPRAQLFQQKLTDLFQWDEATFLKNTEGSAIRRIGYLKWQRNLIIALGNAPFDAEIISQLEMAHGKNDMLDIHIEWSLSQQRQKQTENAKISNSTQRLIRIVQKGLPRDA